MYRGFLKRALFILTSVAVPIIANGLRALGIIVLAHLEGNAAAVEADHILYGWVFFTLVMMILIAIGMAFAEKPDRIPPIRSTAMRKPSFWRFAVAIPAAVLLALAGPAYAYRLDSLFPAAPLSRADSPDVAPPWHSISGALPNWHPVAHGADREFFEAFQAPGSSMVVRYVALYRLRAIGNMLTTSENRLAGDGEWRIAERAETALFLSGEKVTVTNTEMVSGPRRRLVWSFYIVDGRITARLMEAKLLQARAVLLGRAPVAALVAVFASMDDPGNPAQEQLAHFLAANTNLPAYLNINTLR
jgi:EpsI family protein